MIFIAYRRSDDASFAGWLERDLAPAFDVYLDTRSITPGLPFDEELVSVLESADVVLVIIGPGWLSAKDTAHRRRIDDENDWVHQEILRSLNRSDVRVIPVLTGDHPMPTAEDLPAPLRGLASRQGLHVRHESWDRDVDNLAHHLRSTTRALKNAPVIDSEAISVLRSLTVNTISKTIGSKYIKSLYVARGSIEKDLDAHLTRPSQSAPFRLLLHSAKRLRKEFDQASVKPLLKNVPKTVAECRRRAEELAVAVDTFAGLAQARPLSRREHNHWKSKISAGAELLRQTLDPLHRAAREYTDPAAYKRSDRESLPHTLDKLSHTITRNVEGVHRNAQPVYVLIERAGRGKTNLMCDFAQRSARSHPTILIVPKALGINSRALEEKVQEALDQVVEGVGLTEFAKAAGSDRSIVICIDGINESPDPHGLADQLSALLNSIELDNVRFVITCREEYWPLFERVFATHTAQVRFGALGKFGEQEFDLAVTKYFRHFKIRIRVDGDARIALHDPLLLRFFCEAHRDGPRGRRAITEIRRLPLFDTYTERKIGEIADRSPEPGIRASVAERIELIAVTMLDRQRPALARLEIAERLPVGETTRPGSLFRLLLDEDIIIEENLGPLDIQVNFVYEAFMEYVLSRTIRRYDHGSARAGLTWYAQHSAFPNCAGVLGFYMAYVFERAPEDFPLLIAGFDGDPQQLPAVAIALENLDAQHLTSAQVHDLCRLLGTNSTGQAAQHAFVRALANAVVRVNSARLTDILRVIADHIDRLEKFPVEVTTLFDSLAAMNSAWRLAAVNQRLMLDDLSAELTNDTAIELFKWACGPARTGIPDELSPLVESIAVRWRQQRIRWHSVAAPGSHQRPWAFSHAVDFLVRLLPGRTPVTELGLRDTLSLALDYTESHGRDAASNAQSKVSKRRNTS